MNLTVSLCLGKGGERLLSLSDFGVLANLGVPPEE